MTLCIRTIDPQIWIDQILAAKAVARGGVIWRNIAWVDADVGRDRFVSEVRKRGYHLVQTGQQFVVICNTGPIHILF
ncbi:MAG: N-(5'-phosphoribosyl)anthranilate isomerase [Pseudomonadota bacterium]